VAKALHNRYAANIMANDSLCL